MKADIDIKITLNIIPDTPKANAKGKLVYGLNIIHSYKQKLTM